MKMKTNVYVSRNAYRNKLDVFIDRRDSQSIYVAKPVEFVLHEDGYESSPLMQIDNDTAQQFMDQLWTCGIRPSEGTGSAGQLAATERHLSDMKAIAFGLLKKHGV